MLDVFYRLDAGKNECHLFPKVISWNKCRKKTVRNWLTQVTWKMATEMAVGR